MDGNKTSSASVSSVFGWEQFRAEKACEGTRTYVYVTAASSQPKRPHDLFFPPFLWNWQLAVYRLRATMKAAKLFHPSVFTPSIFPFLSCDYDFAAVKQSLPCLKSPLPAPEGPAVPRCAMGLTHNRHSFSGTTNWEVLSAAGAWSRQRITTLPLASAPTLVPHVPELNMELVGNLLHTG